MSRTPKLSKAALLRQWLIPESLVRAGTNWLRYKYPLEKGIYWYWFSLFIRERDVREWGTCISCGKYITMENSNAGHFMPAGNCGRDLLFDPRNVNAECEGCNAWDDTHLLGYAENLDKRYGAGVALSLRKKRDDYRTGPLVLDWSRITYEEKIRNLPSFQQAKTRTLALKD